MPLKSLAHVCIQSCDLDATLQFYCGALGMKKQFDFTRQGRVVGFYLQAGNQTFLEVFETSQVPEKKAGNLSHFCFETESIEAQHQALVQAGYKPGPISLGSDKSYQFWVKDPNGIDFEFHQYTPESAQFWQENVEVSW